MLVIRFLVLLTLAATTWGDEGMIADCLDVAGKLERLVCYDERAREYRREHGADVTTSPQAPSAQTSSAPSAQTSSAPSAQTSSAQTRSPQASTAAVVPIETASDKPVATTGAPPVPKTEPNEENFGKLELIAAPKQVATRIESIIKAPLGNYVMTLSNGQIWSENEPNVRPITAGQNVTITKKRFHYEMRLESGRRVPVRRIDTN